MSVLCKLSAFLLRWTASGTTAANATDVVASARRSELRLADAAAGPQRIAPLHEVRRLNVVRRTRRAQSLELLDNVRTRRGPRARNPGSPVRTRPSCCEAVVLLLAGIPLSLLTIAWAVIGILLTRSVPSLGLLSIATVVALYLTAALCTHSEVAEFILADVGAGFSHSMWDSCIASIIATTIAVVGYRWFSDPQDLKIGKAVPLWGKQCSVIAAIAAVLYTTYAVAKLATWSTAPGSSGSCAERQFSHLVWVSVALSWLIKLNVSRFWRPSSASQLMAAERELLLSATVSPLSVRLVAGMNTIEVHASLAHAEETARGSRVGCAYGKDSDVAGPCPPDDAVALVLVHGFGAGAPLWFRNFDALARRFRVIAVDWLGVGRSERPRFPKHRHGERAEMFFVDALEKWRVEMGLERFVLLGHSLGGIIVTAYVAKYPQHVHQLILASPAMPRPFPEPSPWQFRLVRALWSANITPQGIVRFIGPLGPPIIRRLLRARYSGTLADDFDADALGAYVYHSWCGKGSGEFAMNGVLQPGAAARIPVGTRLHPDRVTFPVTFLFGGGPQEWMSWRQGAAVVDNLRAHGRTADLMFVGHAGHQLFLDEPSAFVDAVVEAVQRADRREAHLAAYRVGDEVEASGVRQVSSSQDTDTDGTNTEGIVVHVDAM